MGNYSPDRRDCSAAINESERKIVKLKNKLTNPKDKGQLQIVEQIAIEATKIHLWKKGYWVMRERQAEIQEAIKKIVDLQDGDLKEWD